MDRVDLRSDTVTAPTAAMRRAMAEAEVGDDVYGEDPTVARLECLAAERLGKAAAVFVPSGTMGNQLAILTHCGRSDEAYAESEAHCYTLECGGAATLAGVTIHPIPGERGRFTPEQLAAAVRPPNIHHPSPRLVCLENTHNRAGGTCWTPAETASLGDTAHRLGLAVHLDGARIFNAAIALGVDARALAEPADSVMFCVSKGLAAPVGSLLCGTSEFAGRARRYRKLLGGGMRQAGILAAAGIVALETMVERLAEDHANARRLAEGLGSAVDGPVETNIVMARFPDAAAAVRRWAEAGVLANAVGADRVRLVTHKDVSAADVDRALRRISRAA